MAAEQPKIEPVKTLNDALEMDWAKAPYYEYFYLYSPTNMIYLYSQGAREIVGKKSDWAKVNREPLPDAWRHRYHIWVPWFRKIVNKDDPEAEPEKVLGGFNDVPCIYSYSQTSGEPIEPKPTPEWDYQQMLGKMGMRQVKFTEMFGGLQGYSRGVELAVSPIAANPLKTIVHEVGHIACGHTLPHHLDEYRTHKGIMEFQAEAVAYVVLSLIGVMDEETARYSRGYIRHYLQDEKPPEQACRQVLTVADRIWRAGRLAQNIGHIAVDDTMPDA